MTQKIANNTSAVVQTKTVQPAEAPSTNQPKRHSRKPIPALTRTANKTKVASTSKRDRLIRLLSAKHGVELSTISEKLGWLPHTTRAALSGLRKGGVPVISEKRPDGKPTRYRIGSAQGELAGPPRGEVGDEPSSDHLPSATSTALPVHVESNAGDTNGPANGDA